MYFEHRVWKEIKENKDLQVRWERAYNKAKWRAKLNSCNHTLHLHVLSNFPSLNAKMMPLAFYNYHFIRLEKIDLCGVQSAVSKAVRTNQCVPIDLVSRWAFNPSTSTSPPTSPEIMTAASASITSKRRGRMSGTWHMIPGRGRRKVWGSMRVARMICSPRWGTYSTKKKHLRVFLPRRITLTMNSPPIRRSRTNKKQRWRSNKHLPESATSRSSNRS